MPDPPPITKLGIWVCTILLAFGSGGTGARPDWVRGTQRAETESPGPRARPGWGGRRRGSPVTLSPRAGPGARYLGGLAPTLPSGLSPRRPFVPPNPRTQEARGRDLDLGAFLCPRRLWTPFRRRCRHPVFSTQRGGSCALRLGEEWEILAKKVCLRLLVLDGWWRHWALAVGRPDYNLGSRRVALGGAHLKQVSFRGGRWDLDSAPLPLGFICHGLCPSLGTVDSARVCNSGFCRRDSELGSMGVSE